MLIKLLPEQRLDPGDEVGYSRIKFVVFVNRDGHVPSATEALWHDRKVSGAELHKLRWPFWISLHLPS